MLFAKSAPARGRGLRLAAPSTRRPAFRRHLAVDPQAVLTDALRCALGADAVLSEVTGLVPGRRYRADIVIPAARLVIEFDGFQYHRSKAAFQKDRERQNLLIEQGWTVMRFFNKQVRDDLDGVVQQVVRSVSSRIEDGGCCAG